MHNFKKHNATFLHKKCVTCEQTFETLRPVSFLHQSYFLQYFTLGLIYVHIITLVNR